MRIRIEAIRPRKSPLIDKAIFDREIRKAIDKTAEGMLADFGKTTRTWKTPVKFYSRPKGGQLGVRGLELTVTTSNKIFQYVEAGTKPHIIRARNAQTLRFLSNYRAKTRPGFIGSTQGGASGEPVYAPEVHHPGTKARNFGRIIAAKHQPKFQANVTAAMARAAKLSGK